MVVERAIENLRQRPKEDRRAIATGVAIGVAAILFLVWTFFFMRTLHNFSITTQQKEAYTAAVGSVDSVTVSVPQYNK